MKWIVASVMGIVAMTALAPMAAAAEEYYAFSLKVAPPSDDAFQKASLVLAGGLCKGVVQLENTPLHYGGEDPNRGFHVLIREGSLTLDGKVLKGQFTTYDSRTIIGTWTMEGNVDGGKATGAYTVKFLTPKTGEEKSSSGKFAGTVTPGSELAKSNAIAAGKDWPCWSGPNHNMHAAPSGQKLVDDLDQARLVWRGQPWLGRPQGSFGHPYNRALFHMPTASGGSAPIVADGRIFATQWFPDGKEYEAEGLKEYAGFMAQSGLKELPPALKLHFSKTCHDWYVCMDAATGQTLWTAEFPEETGGYYAGGKGRVSGGPDHKQGPMGLTPCYGNGKLFGLHLSGYLRAMDAKTGKLLWKQKIAGTVPVGRGNCNCPMFIGGVVMTGNHAGTLYACDPDTGTVLWKGTCDTKTDPQRWVHDGREYAFVKDAQGEYRCLEPKTGKELWKLGGDSGAKWIGYNFWIDGDALAALVGKDTDVDTQKKWQSVSIALYRLTLYKAEKVWEVPAPGPLEGRWGGSLMPLGKYVAVASYALADTRKAWLLDGATGKVAAVAADVAGQTNHGHTQVAEDRLFVKPDGVHGVISFSMLGTTPETFRMMGNRWSPKIPNTTSYAYKCTTMPIVDGRMYIRGADGIYCYDLRKAAP
ncbi:MAG: PQQ-binding-like beta-propeller repeat protein [Thermoguttaceae bacterium]|jgi:outer membrane protein assembly factor BamB